MMIIIQSTLKKRLNILKKFKNFQFKKIDISNKKNLVNFLRNKKFDYVFHFAAQAGVRYTFENPYKYIETNINGFINLTMLFKVKQKSFFTHQVAQSMVM